ncbi:hypothetical protein MSAN_00301700 [Mycena sanguinolenta]|uniref:Uncharacterized protein n=1 Tax=Mycena sanguinolenta TaxID=230812 RepID=A0A8H6Z8D5_9AGAR|nr:hypothetical protein MSAN_00301700 [Mycena sanguinolenta]
MSTQLCQKYISIFFVRIEFQEVRDYLHSILGHHLFDTDCTFLIRRSTGRLCLDLIPGRTDFIAELLQRSMPTFQGLGFLARENSEATAIGLLTLEQYHEISYWELQVFRYLSISPSATVSLGGVFRCSSDDIFDNLLEIAWLPNAELSLGSGWYLSGCGSSFGELMADGWTRLNSNDIVGTRACTGCSTPHNISWLSQANHIFTALEIWSNFQDYVVVDEIDFELSVSTAEGDTPPSFLFLCPPSHFWTGKCSFKWPDCPAYWSLDPSGADKLTLEEATRLGFPSFRLSTQIRGKSWDSSVYAGLCQFHQAKGFDPASQDVARHLGHRLYQVSRPFAHIDDRYSEDDDTSQWATDEEVDDKPDSTLMNHGDLVLGSTHQGMEEVPVFNSVEDIDFPTYWDASVAGGGYSYHSQPNPNLSTSEFSMSTFDFDAHNFGNNLSWFNSSGFNDVVPSSSTLNHNSPMLHNAAQLFPATSLPLLPTRLSAASPFPIAPVVNTPVADTLSKKTKNP